MKKLTNKSGFTLVELMVVIVIVGILAAVAIPKFTVASYKAKASEFPTVLSQMYTAEGAYLAEVGSYADSAALFGSGLSIPSSNNFSYTVSNVTADSTFTAKATVTSAFGEAAKDEEANINQTGTKGWGGSTTGLKKYVPTWK